jgi:hypothetical protein
MVRGTQMERFSSPLPRAILFSLLDPRGYFEVRLTAVTPRREGGVGDKAETHAAFLALGGYHRQGEDNFTGQRELTEEGASEDCDALERARWAGLVIRAGGGDGRTIEAIDNRVQQDEAVGMIGKAQGPGDAEGDLQAESGVDPVAGGAGALDGDAGQKGGGCAVVAQGAARYERGVEQAQALGFAGEVDSALDQEAAERQLRTRMIAGDLKLFAIGCDVRALAVGSLDDEEAVVGD